MKLNIGILGTRGIPNHYGGFEHISGHLSAGLAGKGHAVTVYNSHKHPYTQKEWQGVRIVHCYDPEYLIGTAGQFIYDLNCLLDARKRKFDVILLMGYTSSSIWGRLYPRQSVVVSNMDGLEWKRTKYSITLRRFLKYAEKLAIRYSHFYVADSLVIKSYLQEEYGILPRYIPYGADVYSEQEGEPFARDAALNEDYFLLMARMEPENNIEIILDGFSDSNSTKHFNVLGNTDTRFGKYITRKFRNDERIRFPGANFDHSAVRTLQNRCFLYFHGHSVGGTNPSLLEAMASKALIAAHNNPFNKSVLHADAFYFDNAADVRQLVETVRREDKEAAMIRNNLQKIRLQFNWEKIIHEYEDLILECYHTMKKR